MARLHFSLVSPEAELFSGEADSVLVPGTEGAFEVQAGHSPLMSTLSPGLLVIRDGGTERKIYVRGGFADVSATGLTVLAEAAVPEGELRGETLASQRTEAEEVLASDAGPEERLDAQRAKDALAAY